MAKEVRNGSKNKKVVESKKVIEEKEVVKKSTAMKKNRFSGFLDFISEPSILGTFVIGLILGLVIMRLCFPERIAQLADGSEVVLSYGSTETKNVTADDLYSDMKAYFSVNVLLNDVDLSILDAKYGKSEERKEHAEYYTKYYIDMYMEYYQYTEADALSALGFSTKEDLYEYFELEYLRNKYYDEYMNAQISEADINKYYEDSVYGDYNTKHILVKLAEDASSSDKKAAKALAQEIINRLKKGEKWDDLVAEYGDKITYEDLGVKTFKDSMDAAYVKAARALKVDTYSTKPVLSSFGYHVIYKVAEEEKKPLADIREDVIDGIIATKEAADAKLFYKVLVAMREEANFKIYDTKLNSEYQLLVSSYK